MAWEIRHDLFPGPDAAHQQGLLEGAEKASALQVWPGSFCPSRVLALRKGFALSECRLARPHRACFGLESYFSPLGRQSGATPASPGKVRKAKREAGSLGAALGKQKSRERAEAPRPHGPRESPSETHTEPQGPGSRSWGGHRCSPELLRTARAHTQDTVRVRQQGCPPLLALSLAPLSGRSAQSSSGHQLRDH